MTSVLVRDVWLLEYNFKYTLMRRKWLQERGSIVLTYFVSGVKHDIVCFGILLSHGSLADLMIDCDESVCSLNDD